MAEINNSTDKPGKKSFSTSRNRRSTRVDLTPMVDLGFLLITFFVFTSAMSTPKVMDMVETKDATNKPFPESGALTIIIAANHELYYYYGILRKQTVKEQIVKTGYKEVRQLILNKRKITKDGDLMYIIKATKFNIRR